MTRRRWLIAQLALVGGLALFAFPGTSSALVGTYTISLTGTGPSPSALNVEIAGEYISFENSDTVTHTIAFANGWCAAQIAPGDRFDCGTPDKVGTYAYTVDGTVQASLDVVPQSRAVAIAVKRHGFRLGSRVRLHGTLEIASGSPPASYGPRMPVTVFSRAHGRHVWHRVAVVIAKPLTRRQFPAHSVWHLWVRPRAGTTYMAVAKSQPKSGQFWENAQSKPCGLYVRHHSRRNAAKH